MPRNRSLDEITAFRCRLCAVAERLFAEHGMEAVTMRELARELGVSAMTPYRYFKDKNSILAAVRANAFNDFAAALEQAACVRGNAAERADAVGQAYLHFAFAKPHAYKLMFDFNQPDDGRFPELERAALRARRTMTGYMEALVKGGFLAGDPDILGQVFWATVHGLVVLHLAGKLKPTPDFDTVHRTAMRLLARGAQAISQPEKRRAS
jgi:AcrR family transcriptional regulator